MNMLWVYVIPATIAVLAAMPAAHWFPGTETAGYQRRYSWGLGCVAAATIGLVVVAPLAPAWTVGVGFGLFCLAAALGTWAAYHYVDHAGMRNEVQRGRQR